MTSPNLNGLGEGILTDTLVVDDPSLLGKADPALAAADRGVRDTFVPESPPALGNAGLSRHPFFRRPHAGPPNELAAVTAMVQSAGGVFLPGFGFGLELTIKHQLTLSLEDIHQEFARIYDRAPKVTYKKHGMEFTYAAVSRTDFPYLVAIGSAGMCFGDSLFVVTDFFPDLDSETHSKINELIAVHEYGERIWNNHDLASRLEFAVAQKEGSLSGYLDFLDKNYRLKFRDVVVHRMLPEVRESLDAKEGVKVRKIKKGETDPQTPDSLWNPSVRAATDLQQAFRWPTDVLDTYSNTLEQQALRLIEQDKVGEWADIIVAHEQIKGHIDKAVGVVSRQAQRLKSSVEVYAAFYTALLPLYRELDDLVLTRPKDLATVDVLIQNAGRAVLTLVPQFSSDVSLSDLSERRWEETEVILREIQEFLSAQSREGRLNLEKPSEVRAAVNDLFQKAQQVTDPSGAFSLVAAVTAVASTSRIRDEFIRHFSHGFWISQFKMVLEEAPDMPAASSRLRALFAWNLSGFLASYEENQGAVSDGVAQDLIEITANLIRERGSQQPELLHLIFDSLSPQHLKGEEGTYVSYRIETNDPDAVYERYLLARLLEPHSSSLEALSTALLVLWEKEARTAPPFFIEEKIHTAVIASQFSQEVGPVVIQVHWRKSTPPVTVITPPLLLAAAGVHHLNDDQKKALRDLAWLQSHFIQTIARMSPWVMEAYLPQAGDFAPLVSRILSDGYEVVVEEREQVLGEKTWVEKVVSYQTRNLDPAKYHFFHLETLALQNPKAFEAELDGLDEGTLVGLHAALVRQGKTDDTSAHSVLAILRRVTTQKALVDVVENAVGHLGTVSPAIPSLIEENVSQAIKRWQSPLPEKVLDVAITLVSKMPYAAAAPQAHRLFAQVLPQTRFLAQAEAEAEAEDTEAWRSRVSDEVRGRISYWRHGEVKAFSERALHAVHDDDGRVILSRALSSLVFHHQGYWWLPAHAPSKEGPELWHFLLNSVQQTQAPEAKASILEAVAGDIFSGHRMARQATLKKLDGMRAQYRPLQEVYPQEVAALEENLADQLRGMDNLYEACQLVVQEQGSIQMAIEYLEQKDLGKLGADIIRLLNASDITEENLANLATVAERVENETLKMRFANAHLRFSRGR